MEGLVCHTVFTFYWGLPTLTWYDFRGEREKARKKGAIARLLKWRLVCKGFNEVSYIPVEDAIWLGIRPLPEREITCMGIKFEVEPWLMHLLGLHHRVSCEFLKGTSAADFFRRSLEIMANLSGHVPHFSCFELENFDKPIGMLPSADYLQEHASEYTELREVPFIDVVGVRASLPPGIHVVFKIVTFEEKEQVLKLQHYPGITFLTEFYPADDWLGYLVIASDVTEIVRIAGDCARYTDMLFGGAWIVNVLVIDMTGGLVFPPPSKKRNLHVLHCA
jgi:hypothetical protein